MINNKVINQVPVLGNPIQNLCNSSKHRMNQASLFGPTVDSVWDGAGRRKKGRKPRTGLTAGSNLPTAISTALGDAELYFINGNNEKAIEILSEVTLKAPKLPEPYSILALIYESNGDLMKALQLYALTATFTPKAKSLHNWSKVAELASQLGELDQAIMALKRCINLSPSADFYQEKIRVFLRQKNLGNAKSTLNKLLSRFKNQEFFLVEFGNLALSVGYKDLAVDSFARYLYHLFGTLTRHSNLFPNVVLKSNQPIKPNEYIFENIHYMNEALHRAVDTLLDKPDGVMAAMELIEMCGEWTLDIKAALPPDANPNLHMMPDLPMLVVVMYAVCKLRLQQDKMTDEALSSLQHALTMVDRGELVPHLLIPPAIGTDDGYGLEDLSEDLDLLRQFMRTAIELMAAGINTRAQKLTVFIEKALTSLSCKHIVTHYKDELYLPTLSAQKLKALVEKEIPSVWCELAEVYESSGAHQKALGAYKSSLSICADHAVSLRAYARLTRNEFPTEVVHARARLKIHFQALVNEFASLRAQQGDGGHGSGSAGSSSNNLNAAASSAGQESAKKRAPKRKSDSSAAASGPLEDLRQSLHGHVSQTPSLPVEDTAMDVSSSAVLDADDNESGEEFEADMESLDGDGEADEGQGDGADVEDDTHEEQQIAALHWRAANKSMQFTQDDLRFEILALVEWAAMLKDDNCSKEFCNLIVPLLESWATISITASNEASAGTSSGVPAVKLGRKLRNKEAHTVSMYQLALSKIVVGPGGKPSPLLELLDPTERTCYALIGALAVAVTAELVLPKEALLTLAGQAKAALETLTLTKYGEDLYARAMVKSIEKSTYGNGRPRISRTKFADFNLAGEPPGAPPADDQSGMFSEYAASGKRINLSTSSSNPVVSWNKMHRPAEEPLFTAANKISPQAGALAKQLLEHPHDNGIANAFYREVLTQIDASKANGLIELQLPLSRLALSDKSSVAGQVFSGHDHAMQRKHYLALDKYLNAFTLDPEQPLTALTIGSYLIMLANHKLTKQRHEVLLKGLTFMHRYLVLRRNALSTASAQLATACAARNNATSNATGASSASASSASASGPSSAKEVRELALYQETLYNLGRAFHDIRLFHLASDQYNEALDLARAYPQLAQDNTTVTRATAHNLVQIYKHSGATNLAFDVMQQFLVM